MTDLPKHYHGVRLSPTERKVLEAWAEREQWTRTKSIEETFNAIPGWGGDAMPRNLVAPGIPPRNWGGKGKCVCVMCGYVTTVTNVCRECKELPADATLTDFRFCGYHNKAHFIERDGQKVPTSHRAIAMVCVS